MLNKDGLIELKFKAVGTTKKTIVTIVEPQLDGVDGLISKSAASVLLETAKSAVKNSVAAMSSIKSWKIRWIC